MCTDSTSQVTINVRVNGYSGRWDIRGVTGNEASYGTQHGDRDAILVGVGSTYSLAVGISASSFQFTVTPDGIELNTQASKSATSVGHTLELRNTSVQIDVADFTGLWGLAGVHSVPYPNVEGTTAVVLVPGIRYEMMVGYDGRFGFTVNGDGTITLHDQVPAENTGNGMRFRTCRIHVDTASFSVGLCGISYLDVRPYPKVAGPRDYVVVVGLRYQFRVGYHGIFHFSVDAFGNVRLDDSALGSASAQGNTLTLRSKFITVDGIACPSMNWGIGYITARPYPRAMGRAEVLIVPELRYEFMVGFDGRFFVDVGIDGRIAGISSPKSADIDNFTTPSVLKLKRTPIHVRVGQYAGPWGIAYLLGTVDTGDRPIAHGDTIQQQPLLVVPGIRYLFKVGNGSFFFDVDDKGNIFIPPASVQSAEAKGNTLVLKNVVVHVSDVDLAASFWRNWTGAVPETPTEICFVPGVTYALPDTEEAPIEFEVVADESKSGHGMIRTLNTAAIISEFGRDANSLEVNWKWFAIEASGDRLPRVAGCVKEGNSMNQKGLIPSGTYVISSGDDEDAQFMRFVCLGSETLPDTFQIAGCQVRIRSIAEHGGN